MVDSWCHTWSQWGTNPRIGWCAWSWWLPLLRSHPLAPRLLGREWKESCLSINESRNVGWLSSSNIQVETLVSLVGVEKTLGFNMSWHLEEKTVGVFRKWRVWPATNQELNVKNWTYPNYSRGWPGIWNDLPQFLAIWMRKMILESTQYPMVSPHFGSTRDGPAQFPRYIMQQAMYLPWRGSHFTIIEAGSKTDMVISATDNCSW